MNDTRRIKENYDLRRIVEQDLGQPPVRSGRASLYKCPFHNEQKGYSLAVWTDGYRCFGRCDTSGDLFDWLMTYRRLSFPEALAVLGEYPDEHRLPRPQIETITSEPPPEDWQRAARQVVNVAEETLWSTEGEPALHYLLEQRGLTTTTIRKARLGYIPGDFREWREIAGLSVPCGIAIPWFASDALWAVKVRRAYGLPKYVQIAGGSTHGLYNADTLHLNTVAMFCEGEFDALLVQQEAGNLVSPVTLGSATARLTSCWYGMLVGHRTIYVSYDRDQAGKRGTERLLNLSPRFRELLLPHGKDISDFYLNGGDISAWLRILVLEGVMTL
ncbi:MAG: toprim domain-containing protein [Anaerolineae bacterium]|nr:toprim domain-containing protein [Anaerolineae bacterium]